MKSRKELKRSAMKPRHSPLRSSGKPGRKPRKASETVRIYGPPERREWFRTLPSVASGDGPCEMAHVRNGGIARKADARWTVPLTRHEHRVELHQWGPQTFEAHYGIDLDAEAEKTEAAWQRISNREIL